MGSDTRGNDVFNFGFEVPTGEIIVGVIVRPDHAQANDEQVVLQLLGSGGTLGSPVTVTWPDSGSGNCDSSFYGAYGANDSLTYWGSPALTPAIVNASDFGVRLTKASNGTTKVDAVCIDVYFRDGSGTSSCSSPTNTGTLRITKNTTSGNGSFPFSVDTTPASNETINTTDGSGSVDIANIPPGLYAATEAIPTGWDLVQASCDDDNSASLGSQNDGNATIADININPGQLVECVFIDSPEGTPATGSITVVKEVVGPDPSSDWSFTGTAGISPFTLPASGGSTTITGLSLDPGTYTITESMKANYTAAVSCTPPGTGATNSVQVALSSGAPNAVCTFVNTADPATARVVKTVVGSPPGDVWSFTWPGGTFTLPAGGGATSYANLDPGQSATVSEVAKPGYQVAAECKDDNTAAQVATGTTSVTFTPEPGQDITCTFTNTAVPTSITVTKSVDGGDPQNDWDFEWSGGSDFSIGAQGGSEILQLQEPGNYTITELASNPNFDVSVTCNGGESGTESVVVEVAQGEAASCEFVNRFEEPPPPQPKPTVGVPALTPLGLAGTAAALAVLGGLRARRRRRR